MDSMRTQAAMGMYINQLGALHQHATLKMQAHLVHKLFL